MSRARVFGCLGVLAICFTLWPVGCNGVLPPGTSDSAGVSGSGETGVLKLLIADDPFPYELIAEAWVKITRIEALRVQGDDEADPNQADSSDDNDPNAHVADGSIYVPDEEGTDGVSENDEEELVADADDPNDGDAAGDGPFIVVYDDVEGREYDLLKLQNGRAAELVDADIPVGSYKQLRIIVAGGRVVLTDGREFPLEVPSGEQTGIKLHFDFEITADQESELLLDFDLSRAFVPIPGGQVEQAGDIREFHFRPSHAMRLADLDESGGLSGTVDDGDGVPCAYMTVRVSIGGEEVATTVTEADGSYAFIGLSPGEYCVQFEGDCYEDRELCGQLVRSGEVTSGVNVGAELAP